MSLSLLSSLLFVALVVSICQAFSGSHVGLSSTQRSITALNVQTSRSDFMHAALKSVFLTSTAIVTTSATIPTPAAFAADETLKGTKKDPVYESCLSDCMFYCTKPKGEEQKSRGECLPECKVKCATTKAQLLKGVPLKK